MSFWNVFFKRDPISKIEDLTKKVTQEVSGFTDMLEVTATGAETAENETTDAIDRLRIALDKIGKTKKFCRKMLEFLRD